MSCLKSGYTRNNFIKFQKIYIKSLFSYQVQFSCRIERDLATVTFFNNLKHILRLEKVIVFIILKEKKEKKGIFIFHFRLMIGKKHIIFRNFFYKSYYFFLVAIEEKIPLNKKGNHFRFVKQTE